MIFLDTRESLYFNSVSYSDQIIDYCKKNINSNKINIIITPRPLFHLSVVSASIIGFFVRDARDSTIINNTINLKNLWKLYLNVQKVVK